MQGDNLLSFFPVEITQGSDIHSSNEIQLLDFLKKRIAELIQLDFERLINILYRFDVSEESVKQALAQTDVNLTIEQLSLLMIQRAKQKQKIRKKYSS